TPARTPVAEGSSTMLTFASVDPPGTVVNYFSSLETDPIPGAEFDPISGTLTFSPPFDHLDSFPNPTVVTLRAQGTELDTAEKRVPTGNAVFDIDEVTSFSLEIQAIFRGTCAIAGCHSGATPAASMNLSLGQSYANIVNVAPMGPECGFM